MAAKNRHNQETILFILMGLIVIGLIISGYFLFVKKILPEFEAEKRKSSNISVNNEEEVQIAQENFIPDQDAQILSLYFPERGSDFLRVELRRVRRKKMLTAQAKQIIEEILRGPEKPELYSAIPENTNLRGLFFDKGTFIIDLTSEFSQLNNMGAIEQAISAYSIINSLTELDPGAKIRFLINGSEPTDEYGHIDLTRPMTRLKDLIKE
jgi:spore germination protein GerM